MPGTGWWGISGLGDGHLVLGAVAGCRVLGARRCGLGAWSRVFLLGAVCWVMGLGFWVLGFGLWFGRWGLGLGLEVR